MVKGLITVEININAEVEVKLSEHGLEVYNKYLDGLIEYYKEVGWTLSSWERKKEEINETKVLKCQLWELMQLFGNEMYMGTPSVFESDLKIKG